jgi:ribosomal protein S4
MPYPGYKLNPGDMFQVDPEKVLYATGAPKVPISKRPQRPGGSVVEEKPAAEAVEAEAEEAAAAAEQDPDTTDKPEVVENTKPTRKAIQSLIEQARETLVEEKLNVKHKQALRSFVKQARKLASSRSVKTNESLAAQLNDMMSELQLSEAEKPAEDEAAATEVSAMDLLTPEELRALERRLAEEEANPRDESKPYATPWRPRPFMSPFAFIPQYLEVNHNICAAVYLRHPVARLGSAEVPTPFPYYVNQLAFTWYLRRR